VPIFFAPLPSRLATQTLRSRLVGAKFAGGPSAATVGRRYNNALGEDAGGCMAVENTGRAPGSEAKTWT